MRTLKRASCEPDRLEVHPYFESAADPAEKGRCVTFVTTDAKHLTAGGESDLERVCVCFSVNQYLFVDCKDMFTYLLGD